MPDKDGLTGAGTRGELQWKINFAILSREPTRFVARYLCIDIDDLKAFLDIEGLGAGDDALIKLGRALIEHYGEESVFRVGGDDFVVELGDRQAWLPKVDALTIKHAILEVAVQRNPARNHRVCNGS